VRDTRWRVEETTDDDETWGNMTAGLQGVSTRKELRNGMAKQRLAGGDCGGDLPRHYEKMVKGKEASATRVFYRCRETEWVTAVPHVGVSQPTAYRAGRDAVRASASGSPVPVPLTCGLGTGLKPFPVGVAQWAALLTWSDPQKYVFQFSKLQQVCNI
jgi:hypothetical protein